MSENPKKIGTRGKLSQLDQKKAAAATVELAEAEEAQFEKLQESADSENSSEESDNSSGSSSDSDNEILTTSGDGLVKKRFKTIPLADKATLRTFENLMSQMAQLPAEISNKGGHVFSKFGMDLRDFKIQMKDILKNQAGEKVVRKLEKIELKKIILLSKTIYQDLFEENYGTLGSSLISIVKEGPFFKEVVGRRQSSKILQQLKSLTKNYHSVSNASLRQIPSWKKFEKKRSFSTKKGESSKKVFSEKKKKD